LNEPSGVEEAVEDFIHKMEKDDFLAWEAVMAEEQGLPLTKKQEAALGELMDFSDGEDNRVLYIDDIPRPNEPWHVILNKIVPHTGASPTPTMPPATSAWRLAPSNRRSTATTVPSPSAATATPGGC
jgi:hypothetical protein